MLTKINLMFGCIALITILLLTGPDTLDDQISEQRLYCEMVMTYRDSGGQYGWPDYKKIAELYCYDKIENSEPMDTEI